MYIRFLNCLSLIFVCNQVRGAPAIAIVGSLSLAVELRKLAAPEMKKDLYCLVKEKLKKRKIPAPSPSAILSSVQQQLLVVKNRLFHWHATDAWYILSNRPSVIWKKNNKIKGCSAKIELLAFLHRREKKKGISLWFFDNNKSRGPDTGPLARAPNGRKTDRDHVEMPVIDGKYIICTSKLFAVLHRLIFIRGRRARGFQEPSGANAGVAAFQVGVIIYGESFFA